MSNSVQGQVWKTVKLDSPAEMLLLVAYADITNDFGGGIWASEDHMAHKTGLSMRTIQAIRKKWREMGVLTPIGFVHLKTRQEFLCDVNVKRGAGGRGWSTIYQLSLDPLPKKEIWRQDRPQKVAVGSTFNRGIEAEESEQKVAVGATFTEQKVAMDAPEGRNGCAERSQIDAQKVAESSNAIRKKIPRESQVEPKGKAEPPVPPVVRIALEKFYEHIKRSGPDTSDPEFDRKMLTCIWDGCGALTRTEAKEALGRDPRWRKWPYWELIDSQREINFDSPAPVPPPQPIIPEATAARAWQVISERVNGLISPHSFDTWLKPLRGMRLKEGRLMVQVPTRDFKHVGEKFEQQIEQARALAAGVERVEFLTPEELGAA